MAIWHGGFRSTRRHILSPFRTTRTMIPRPRLICRLSGRRFRKDFHSDYVKDVQVCINPSAVRNRPDHSSTAVSQPAIVHIRRVDQSDGSKFLAVGVKPMVFHHCDVKVTVAPGEDNLEVKLVYSGVSNLIYEDSLLDSKVTLQDS